MCKSLIELFINSNWSKITIIIKVKLSNKHCNKVILCNGNHNGIEPMFKVNPGVLDREIIWVTQLVKVALDIEVNILTM